MDPYVVEVEVSTHDDLKIGVLALPRVPTGSRYSTDPSMDAVDRSRAVHQRVVNGPCFTTVVISPDEVSSDAEAMCLAAQIATCTSEAMPTATTLISWPIERTKIMPIDNPCEGSGGHPRRRRITPRDLGTKFGGKPYGECPEGGCDVPLTPGGRLRKHEQRQGEFERRVSTT